MKESNVPKLKITIIFASLFLVVSILLLLIFFAGKKSYSVTFELNGGTLLSGSLEQKVTRGQDATPPVVSKDGAYLHSWSTSYRQVTKDLVIEAVWEYKTTPGIIYDVGNDRNFVEISGAFKQLKGEVYVGAYYNEKKVLGIKKGAFSGCTDITGIYLLEGLITIEEEAFSGCSSLKSIEIPDTVTTLGDRAFADCTALEQIVLHEGLVRIGNGAFSGCSALREVVIPTSVAYIDSEAFAGCDSLVVKVPFGEEDVHVGWAEDWFGSAYVEWHCVDNSQKDESGNIENGKEE